MRHVLDSLLHGVVYACLFSTEKKYFDGWFSLHSFDFNKSLQGQRLSYYDQCVISLKLNSAQFFTVEVRTMKTSLQDIGKLADLY